MSEDWEKIRKQKSSGYRPENWPPGVHAISIDGMALLGIHEKDNKLYWDGQELVTKTVIRFGWIERTLAGAAAIGTFGVFVLELGKVLCWWS